MPRPDTIAEAAAALDGAAKMVPSEAAPSEMAMRARRMIDLRIAKILNVILDAAEAGDYGAQRLVLERSIPVAKSAPLQEPIDFEGLSLPERAEKVLAWLASGRITLEESESLLRAIGITQQVTDQAALVERLARLERIERVLAASPRDVIDVKAEPVGALPAPKVTDDGDAF